MKKTISYRAQKKIQILDGKKFQRHLLKKNAMVVFAISLFFIFSISCQKAKEPETKKELTLATMSPGNNPILFYFEPLGDHCNWVVHNVGLNKKHVFHSTKKQPEDLIFDLKRKEVIYLENNTVFMFGWNGKQLLNKWDVLPSKIESPELVINKGRIIALGLVYDNVKVKEKNKKVYYEYQNETYDASTLPSWGEPCIAVAVELANDKISIIKKIPTKCGAGDTPCLDDLAREFPIDDNVVSLVGKLLYESTLIGYPRKKLNDDNIFNKLSLNQSKELLSKLEIISGAGPNAINDNEWPAYVKITDTGGILVKVSFGDTPHFNKPAYFCSSNFENLIKIDLPTDFEQLAISVHGKNVLIAEEYSNNNACIYEFGNTNPFIYIKNGSNVIFEPVDNFWEIFSSLNLK